MLSGKVSPELLKKLVFPRLGARRPEVLVPARLGEDCSLLDLDGELCVLSSDPITGATQALGRLAIHIACNDLAACGARPVGVLLTLLLPPSSGETELAELMEELHCTARELEVTILGGHTEVTAAVAQTVVLVTAVGKVPPGRFVTSAGARPGDRLWVTKTLGLEGTAILARERAEELRSRFDEAFLARARGMLEEISVLPEGLAAAAAGATAMHDVTEGGILGAASELAEASGVGLELWEDALPVAPETRALAAYFGIDYRGLISSGALLIAAPPEVALAEVLAAVGVRVTEIGRVLAPEEGRFLVEREGGGHKPLAPPPRDELYVALKQE